MKANGSAGRTIAASEKISFCMFDQVQIDPSLENAASDPLYSGRSCSQNTNVGYSVSWGDEYAYNFADQDIDITGVAPGNYWVLSTADPAGLIEETNDSNNEARTAIVLRRTGNQMDVLTTTENHGSICAPCGRTTVQRGNRYRFAGNVDPAPGPGPTYPTPKIKFAFKKPGADVWRPFGGSGSDKPFRFVGPSDGFIEVDGSWGRHFKSFKAGTWLLRALYAGNENFTGSSAMIEVEVD